MSKLSPQDQDYARGLLAERAGYLQSKKKDRAAAVDKELSRIGYSDGYETATVDPRQEVAVITEPKAAKPKARRKPAKTAPKTEPRAATVAEEKAVAATVKAEAVTEKAPEPGSLKTSAWTRPSEDAP